MTFPVDLPKGILQGGYYRGCLLYTSLVGGGGDVCSLLWEGAVGGGCGQGGCGQGGCAQGGLCARGLVRKGACAQGAWGSSVEGACMKR
ncbi:hypothetical protein [Bartonella krasnovii]|uniref:hypothetical protein n=1 Tax=Bartonella krasnovii TaxID=2267275 RepID=UPI001F4CE1B3|nr:hypothetical protein [Bartonella krasnovii]UNF46781.1 hypothetical protein MNL05_06905 [Bartonella krasnovii]